MTKICLKKLRTPNIFFHEAGGPFGGPFCPKAKGCPFGGPFGIKRAAL